MGHGGRAAGAGQRDEVRDEPGVTQDVRFTRFILHGKTYLKLYDTPGFQFSSLAIETCGETCVIEDIEKFFRSSDEFKQDLLALAVPPFAAEEIPARYVLLRKALGSGRFGGIHFTGHGSIERDAGAGAEIVLEKLRFTPRDLSGVVANLRERRPFVFFNACQVGRQGQGLAGPDGWAAAFLRAGAGAFLGTYWPVSDEVARCFARHVYEKLFAGETIGEAVRHARCRVRDDFPESATWLAYTLYADPLAKLGSAEAGAERPAA